MGQYGRQYNGELVFCYQSQTKVPNPVLSTGSTEQVMT